MSFCRCGHDRVLHNPDGACLALVVRPYIARCGCPEYRFASKAEEPR